MTTALGRALLFFTMNSMVGATAFVAARSLFSLKGVRDLLLGTFLLYLSEIFAVGLFWGSLNQLQLLPILDSVTFLFLMALFFGRRGTGSTMGREFKETLGRITQNRVILLSASVLFGYLATKVIYNLRYPPLGWDSLGYHLLFPVEWFKRGRIWFPQVVFSDPAPSYYPFLGSLYFFWLLLPFHNAFMADVGQLPFYLALLLATYGLCRRIGLDQESSFYGAFLFGLIPNVLKQVEISYVDLIVASHFMCALYFLSLLQSEWNFSHLFFASLSIGFLIGTKTTGLFWAPFLFPYFVAAMGRALRKGKRDFFFYGITSLALILLFGGVSYVRSFLLTGNFTYPVGVKLGPYSTKGVVPYSGYRYHPHAPFEWGELYFHNGLGAQLLLLVTPGLFLSLFLEFWKKKPHLERLYWSLLPFFIFLIYVYVNPNPGNVRYIYQAFAIGCVVGLFAYQRLFPKKLVRAFVILCVISSAAELAGHWELFFSLFFTAILMGLGELHRQRKLKINIPSRRWVPVGVSLLLVILAFLELLNRRYEYDLYPRSQFSNYDARLAEGWKWVNDHTPPSGSKVAYAGSWLPYPLYGTDLKNEVMYVTVNGAPTAVHLCGGDYRKGARYKTWEKMLLEKGVDLLVIYNIVRPSDLPPFIRLAGATEEYPVITFPIEEEWARSHLERLKPVFQNERVHIYAVQREGVT